MTLTRIPSVLVTGLLIAACGHASPQPPLDNAGPTPLDAGPTPDAAEIVAATTGEVAAECGAVGAQTLTADVVATDDYGNRTDVTLDVGANDGVAVGWAGTLVDGAGHALAGSGFCITRVKPHSSHATVSLPAKVIHRAGMVARVTGP